MLWDWDGTLERVHHALNVATRERGGREANPSTAIIDSQSVKAAQTYGPPRRQAAFLKPCRPTLRLLIHVSVGEKARRRHLDESQRAMVAAKIPNRRVGRP